MIGIMVYKKYIKRGNKFHGPYIYKSVRVGDKVITQYVGKKDIEIKETKTNLKFLWLFLPVLLVLIFFVVLLFFLKFPITPAGRVSLELSPSYQINETISGNLNLNFKHGELIPKNSVVKVNLGNQEKEMALFELIILGELEGNFYAENIDLIGEGLGYGFPGKKISKPEIEFELLVYKEVEEEKPEENITEEISTEQLPEEIPEQPAEEVPEEATEEPTEQPAEEQVEQPAEEKQETEEPETSPITGEAVKENKIYGKIKAGEKFEYNLEQGEKARIIEGSVKINNKKADDSIIKLEQTDSQIIITTDYQEEETGFGSDFLTEDIETISISLEKFELIAEPGSLNIEIIYNDIQLISSSKEIKVEGVEEIPENITTNITEINVTNITEINITTNITANITIPENITEVNVTEINITEINITEEIPENITPEIVGNITIPENITEINITIQEKIVENLTINTSKAKIKIGLPVKWKANLKLGEKGTVIISLPSLASNINVFKITGEVVEEPEIPLTEEIPEQLIEEQEFYGEEVAGNCSDTDKGMNYNEKGILNYQGKEFEDYCYDENRFGQYLKIAEYYCDIYGKMQISKYKCENTCEEGRCVEIEEKKECKDSDDGLNYAITGTACIDEECKEDICLDDKYLSEAYCIAEGEIDAKIFECPYKCENSKCIEKPKIDTREKLEVEEIPKEGEKPAEEVPEEVTEEPEEIKEEPKVELEKERTQITAEVISGEVTADIELEKKPAIIRFFIKFFRRITGRAVSSITGKAIVTEERETIRVTIRDNATEYDVEYDTPSPYSTEKLTARGKLITITGPDELNYTDIVAYTYLPKETPSEKVKLYHLINYTREEVSINKHDLNNNSLIDFIEWIVPHLSNETYELVIEIIKAEHLDENKNFISDIYNETYQLDDIWSEIINNQEYVRVVFEQALTKNSDITLYARSISGSSDIGVYKEDGNETIAVFEKIKEEDWYKVYLTGLNEGETYDTFDLRVLKGKGVEYDYIVDPTFGDGNIDFVPPTPASGTNTSTKHTINITIDQGSYTINNFNWSWSNGTQVNTSFYDNSLVFMMNFGNFSALGENGTSVVDMSKYSNNGTINGSSNWTSSGRYGGAYHFNGINESIGISDSSSLDAGIKNKLTISLWMKMEDNRILGCTTFLNKFGHNCGGNLDDSYHIGLGSSGGSCTDIVSINFQINPGDATKGLTATKPVNDSLWHHVLGVYNGSDMYIYIDGLLNASSIGAATANINDGTYPLYIGRAWGTGATQPDCSAADYMRQFNGTIDEIRIWNRSFSTQEIEQIYKSNLAKYNSTHWEFISNQSGLTAGNNYSYFATAWDTAGNSNSTETRDLNITATDTNPQIIFVSPTPSSGTNTTNNHTINITIDQGSYTINNFNWSWSNGTQVNTSFYDDDLVLMYNFDNLSSLGENATYVVDMSKYGNNGTVYTGGTWTSSGKYGGAYVFDGIASAGNNIQVENSAGQVYNNTPISISMWYYKAGLTATTQTLFSHPSTGTPGNRITWSHGAGDNNIDIRYGNKTTVNVFNCNLNTWCYFVSVSNMTDYKAWGNGASVTDWIPYSKANNMVDVVIGALDITGLQGFNGTIDEVRIYNRTLTDNEILQMYKSNLQKFNSTHWEFISNQSGLTEGINYTYFATAWDTAGNSNSTETRDLNITGTAADTEYPIFSSFSDNNATYSGQFARFNVSIVSTNGTAILTLNSTNYTANNLTATVFNVTTNLTVTGDYNYTWSSYGNGTSKNYNITALRWFSVNSTILDTTPPTFSQISNNRSSIYYIPHISVDFNATDDVAVSSFQVNYTTKFNISSNDGVLQNTTSLGVGFYQINVSVNDTSNNFGFLIYTVEVNQSGAANITLYLDGLTANKTITSNSTVWLNATLITGGKGYLDLYNNGSLINNASTSPAVNQTNFTDAGNFNITALFEGNENYTSNWTYNLWVHVNQQADTISPTINITYPLNTTYNINVSILNYTYSDANPSSCWQSNNNGTTNSTSTTSGLNFTSVTSYEGSNNWSLYCNDSSSNNASNSIVFFKDTIKPQINITTPLNNTKSKVSGLNINYTVSDTNLQKVWWTNNSGTTNWTLNSGANITNETWAEGNYNVIIYTNDTLNNQNSTAVNFTSDFTTPQVTIISPTATTYSSTTINLDFRINEPGNCTYTKDTYSSTGAGGIIMTANSSYTGFINPGETFSNAPHELYAYCNDSAGNLNNSVSVTFTISSSPGTGGGSPPPEECTDDCTSGEEKQCVNITSTKTKTCGNYDIDSCLEWSDWSYTNCGENRQCSGGQCIPTNITNVTCTPEWRCTEWGSCYPVNETQYQSLITGSAINLKPIVDIFKSQACENLGEKICHTTRNNYYQECIKSGKKLQWKSYACASGLICSDGSCVCSDKNSCSQEGEKLCKGNYIYECKKDKNNCLKLVRGNRCATGLLCKEGECIIEHCFDNIKNYDEERIDCGGSCKVCLPLELGPNQIILGLGDIKEISINKGDKLSLKYDEKKENAAIMTVEKLTTSVSKEETETHMIKLDELTEEKIKITVESASITREISLGQTEIFEFIIIPSPNETLIQTRTCTDKNNCGITIGKPDETRLCGETCTENWGCTDWTDCTQHKTTRACTDLDKCGTTISKPDEEQDCNNKPIIEQYTPGDLNVITSKNSVADFSATVSDRDRDVMTIIWKLDGQEVKRESVKDSISSYSLQFSEIKIYSLNLKVDDGYDSAAITWQINVIEADCIDQWECEEWTDCIVDMKYRNCERINPECPLNIHMPSLEWQDPNCIYEYGCVSKWNISGWRICGVDYTLKEIAQGKQRFEGAQERLWQDLEECKGPRTEKKVCNLSVPIEAKKVKWCEEIYVEIRERENNNLISRVRETKTENISKLDIGFIVSNFTGYCDYCFDNIKNYDEERIDCGGPHCPPCIEYAEGFRWWILLVISLWVLLLLLIIFLFVSERKKLKNMSLEKISKKKRR